MRRRTPGLRDNDDPVLLVESGEPGTRRPRRLRVGVSLTREGEHDAIELRSELSPSCESPNNDADRLPRRESVEETTDCAESEDKVREIRRPVVLPEVRLESVRGRRGGTGRE